MLFRQYREARWRSYVAFPTLLVLVPAAVGGTALLAYVPGSLLVLILGVIVTSVPSYRSGIRDWCYRQRTSGGLGSALVCALG